VTIDPVDLGPELGEAVARARSAALATGELRAGRGPYRSPLPPEARDAVLGLLRDGTYDEVVLGIVADEPDLADE
jgi:hypothetical protein